MASAAGVSRSGASASSTQNSSPSTKRADLTVPSRYLAARSPRANVRRAPSIAFAQHFVDRARRLSFAAFVSRRLGGRIPAVDIDIQPAFGVGDETLHE